jgi:hypothetical protein
VHRRAAQDWRIDETQKGLFKSHGQDNIVAAPNRFPGGSIPMANASRTCEVKACRPPDGVFDSAFHLPAALLSSIQSLSLAMNHIDHIVINTRDRTDEAVAFCERMGFIVTPRGYHTLGSINHTIVFQHQDYLELLGYPAGQPPAQRPELVQRPAGLMSTVLNADDADRVRAMLLDRGLAPRPVSNFSRPVDLGAGKSGDAAFRVTRLEPDAVPGSWLYYCQQLTPEFVWRPEWQAHPNAVTSMTRLLIDVNDPVAAAPLYLRAMEGAEVAETGASLCVIRLPGFEISLAAATGAPGMRKLTFGTPSLKKTASVLAQAGVAHQVTSDRISIDAQNELGCILEFEAA